ncbi:glycosyltransferase family 4 protein [Salinibacter ruber]|uniref:glycosyltransferase family 4 protein n=1 Tax=Salinibacter ruber TaxID=146919 RepID=UPI00207419EB|nr:glycosyltransferase family 4 protein [Salinibacter ruber]
MNIALTVDPEIPVPPKLYGGIERIVYMLVNGLVDRGHDVTAFAHEESDVPCRLIPYGGTRAQHPVDLVRNTATVSRLVAESPDVVHSFGRLVYLSLLLPLPVPKIMSYQRHVTTNRIRWAHTLARTGSLLFTGCSEHITDEIRPHAPARTVYNGVPLDTYDYVPSAEADAPLVFLGRIAQIKGTHRAVEVARQSGRRLLIAGNVPDEETDYFDQYVRPHLDGEQIRHVGPVDDEEKNQLLGRAAAFLMPIEWDEPFGIVMAEAMACGTPVIGTRRGSIPEVVEQGTTGFICDDTQEMVDAVGRIDELSRSACRERCEKHFSDHAIVDAYESLYMHHASE